MIRRTLAALLLLGVASIPVAGQAASVPPSPPQPATPRPSPAQVTAVQIRVRDSAGVAISGAEVSVLRGLNDIRGQATTGDNGRALVHLSKPAAPDSSDDYQVIVRKIGFFRDNRFIRLTRDSATFDVGLIRAAQALAPVVVNEQQDIKRKAYHVDADQIANSNRPIFNAADVLAKMRTDMICGRSCSPMASLSKRVQTVFRKCMGLVMSQPMTCPPVDTVPSLATNIWVNGKPVRIAAIDDVAIAHQTGVLAGLSPASMSVLWEILPEHIDEMTYADEFDKTVNRPGAQQALFIVLKPGVEYSPGAPSYVVSDATTASTDTTSDASAEKATELPVYRYRMLGLYDAETGNPIADAIVKETATGSFVKTSGTGTISLVFLAEGKSPLHITRDGYRDLDLEVEINPTLRAPLTLVMERQKP
jgi:hypothetical protein